MWHEGQYKEAESGLRDILGKCPGCPTALYQLVGCLYELKRFDEADVIVERVLSSTQDDERLGEFMGAKGDLLLATLGPEAAEPWFIKAAELDPYVGNKSAVAEILMSQGKTEAAADAAEECLAGMPYDSAIIAPCTQILIDAGRFDAVKKLLKDLAARDHELPHYHGTIAAGLVKAGLRRKGLALAKRTAAAHPESVATTCGVSQLLLSEEHYKAAAPLLRRLLKLDPAGHGKTAIMNLAHIAAQEEDHDKLLTYAVQGAREYDDKDTRRLLKKAMATITGEIEAREAALDKLATENVSIIAQHEALEEKVAGYDLTEHGTNLEFALEEGEGQHIEFKDRKPDQTRDLAREIAAFSSCHQGGTIFIGVDDSGTVVGAPDTDTLPGRDAWRHWIAQVSTKTVQPPNPVTVYFNEHDGLPVVKIWVPDGTSPLYYVDRIAYVRNIDESRKAEPREVEDYIARRSQKR